MTAVVGILNKHAVAIAADSAVTIGGANGRKIFNKANKVFALSKYHPVGIMIYNSASFMSTPWETIIKVYRNQLHERSLLTLKQYQEDFIEFLRSKEFYTTADTQLEFLKEFVFNIINELAKEHLRLLEDPTSEKKALFDKAFENEIEKLIELYSNTNVCCPEFESYTIEHFESYAQDILNQIKNLLEQKGISVSKALSLKIDQAIYLVLISQEDISNYTGLIFTGFGENEIYPGLIPLNISMVIDNRLRYHIQENETVSISNESNGAVCPFAQTDVIDTILSGIDPSLDRIYLKNFNDHLKKYNQAILASIGDKNPLLSAQIKELNTELLVEKLNEINQEIKRENYITPLMDAVSTLAKEDLAEMAESLIYLTYLKRRITFAEESVGGPVDVAIISKGDGFVWIKRKHYFSPELNQHFLNNYFNK